MRNHFNGLDAEEFSSRRFYARAIKDGSSNFGLTRGALLPLGFKISDALGNR